MRIAETVTFGGSGLDRAADARGQAQALFARESARTIVMWRGKPLVSEGALVQLPTSHPVVQNAQMSIMLGRDADTFFFASDISDWQPENVPEAELNSFFDASTQNHPELPESHVFAELRGQMTQLSARDAELAATARAVLNWHRSHRFCASCGEQSEMTMGGWQRDCAHCGTKHFPRTDPVVIMLITRGNSVLLGRSPGWPDGMYSLLAGFVEPGETMEAAVRREVLEETNIQVGEVTYLASQPWPFPASLMLGCAGIATTSDITIDPAELDDAIWLTREELADVFAGRHKKVLPARKGAIAHFLMENWLADRLD